MLLLGQIVQALAADFEARLLGPADLQITALAPIETASAGQLSFVAHPKYQSKLAQSGAGCVVVGPALEALALERGAAIVVDLPYLYVARITQLWKLRHRRWKKWRWRRRRCCQPCCPSSVCRRPSGTERSW